MASNSYCDASIRYVGPTMPTGNFYIAPRGNSSGKPLRNFEFSVNPGSLLGIHSLLTITVHGGSSMLDPNTSFGVNTPVGGPFYQNSENWGFAFLGGPLNFNPNASGIYTLDQALQRGRPATGRRVDTGQRRATAVDLGDVDPWLRRNWLHGLSPEIAPGRTGRLISSSPMKRRQRSVARR